MLNFGQVISRLTDAEKREIIADFENLGTKAPDELTLMNCLADGMLNREYAESTNRENLKKVIMIRLGYECYREFGKRYIWDEDFDKKTLPVLRKEPVTKDYFRITVDGAHRFNVFYVAKIQRWELFGTGDDASMLDSDMYASGILDRIRTKL